MEHSLLNLQPPEHTRLRRLIAPAFTPRAIGDLRSVVVRQADSLAQSLAQAGGGNLVTEVAQPLPMTAIAHVVGIPKEDWSLVHQWSKAVCAMFELQPSQRAGAEAEVAAKDFITYLRELIIARRRSPGLDLMSSLIAAQGGDGKLTEDEIIATCVLVVNAGYESTASLIGNAWMALFRNPSQLASLRTNRAPMSTAVDELLRYDTSLQLFRRSVAEELEIGGTVIPSGGEVALLFGSANHDAKIFENPEELDLCRTPNRHISFGAGIHYCIGRQLARIELSAALESLLCHAPQISLCGQPIRSSNFVVRSMDYLPVTIY
jgi:unspecific monooxygenase